MTMCLPVLLFSVLCSLAHGLPKSLATPSGASTSPDMTIQVSEFHAWTTETDSMDDNWATFLAYDEEYTYGAICSIRSDTSLYSTDSWYPCEMQKNATEMAMSFQLLDGFSEVGIMKGWDSNGYVLRSSLLGASC
jgi:hypothetical protein